MNNGLVISDTGPIISLAVIDKLEILDNLFEKVYIPKAVWNELTKDPSTDYFQKVANFFENRVKEISSFNELTFVMDYGESESVILFKELNADYLLIDDKKARKIAENFGIQCIGTIGILAIAKEKGIVDRLRPLFESFLENKRYYSLTLLNNILNKYQENEINDEP